MSRENSKQTNVRHRAGLASAASLLLFAFCTKAAPPVAISDKDALMIRQLSTVTSDWSETAAFDLENPVSFDVIIQGVEQLEDKGYVTLLYQLDVPADRRSALPFDPDAVFKALLQSASEIDRQRISLRSLRSGTRATLVGWPRTQRSAHPHQVLVKSITLESGGERIGFHDDNTRLLERTARSAGVVAP